ncbi:MAG TPA: hypothetical protein VNL96_09955 [Gemmatimonadaceae bacterium]|nr:hypothetical protein [Gemmatimonadaceae bacterium]
MNVRQCATCYISIVVALTTACYTYVPAARPIAPGTEVGFEVNDRGRVALGPRLGPGVVRVEGRLVASDSTRLVVDAARVTQLRGLPIPIDTVRLEVALDLVERIEERRLARGRTWMAIGLGAGVVAAFVASKGFSGRGVPPEENPVGPPVNEALIPWIAR